ETALQRSTVSLIVDELTDQGRIEEVSGESTGVRRPSLLSLRTAHAVAMGVDLGAMNTVVATSDLAGRVISQEEFSTDPDAATTARKISECALRVMAASGGTIEGIGISF